MAPMGAKDVKKDTKKDEKVAPKPMSPELKELKEKEKLLEKVGMPDRTEMDETLAKIQGAADKIQEELKELNEEISRKSVGKEDHQKAKAEIRAKLDEYQAEIDKLEEGRKLLQGKVKSTQNEARAQRDELHKMKKKVGFESEADIDAEIRKIESEMMTTSISLKEEKKKMDEIKELKKSKPQVLKLLAMEGKAGGGDVTAMRGDIDEVFAKLTEVREAKKLTSEAYRKLMDARTKVMGDVPELFQKREVLQAQFREQMKLRSESRDKFFETKKAYDAYMNEVRALRAERSKLERAERQKEWDAEKTAEKEAEGPPPAPFAEDLQYLGNLVKYCGDLKPKKKEEAAATANEAFEGVGGHEVLIAKGKRDEEFFFAPTKVKKLKVKGSKKAKPLVHNLETLGFFDKYKVSPPTTEDQLDATLEAVQKKIVQYEVKQKEAIAKAEAKAAKGGNAEEAEEEQKEEEKKEE